MTDKLKKANPKTWEKLSKQIGLSGTTPEAVSEKIASSGNTMVAQSFIASAVKAGFSVEQIGQALPVLTRADLEQLKASVADVETLISRAAEKDHVDVKGDPAVVLGQLVANVERVCRVLGCTSEQLSDVLAFVNTHAPSDIRRYQTFVRASGRRPI
jgi:hypothetical protein